MGKSKRARYEQIREEIERKTEDGSISQRDREHIFEFLDAKDPECTLVNDPTDKPKSDGTLAHYAYTLKRVADLADFELMVASPDELNSFCKEMTNGRINGVKDEGLTKGTVANIQKIDAKIL